MFTYFFSLVIIIFEAISVSYTHLEDCCTIFVAKHPVTKPNINRIKKSEERLNDVIDELMKTAIDLSLIHIFLSKSV